MLLKFEIECYVWIELFIEKDDKIFSWVVYLNRIFLNFVMIFKGFVVVGFLRYGRRVRSDEKLILYLVFLYIRVREYLSL